MTDQPLSLDEAARMLAASNAPEEAPEAPETEQPDDAPEVVDEATHEAAEPEESTEEAPADEQADSDDGEEQAEAYEPIEPPSSWSKADKELFNSLPAEAQQAIAQRERDRDNEIFRRQQEFAEQQKALEEQRKAIEAERERYVKSLTENLPKPPSKELLESDPVEYLKQQAEYQEAVEASQKAIEEHQQKAQEQYAKWVDNETRQLSDPSSKFHIPGYADREKGPQVKQELAKYAMSLGAQPQELAGLSAMQANVLWKAMQWDSAQTKAKASKAKPVPKVSAPGTAKSKNDLAADKRADALRKLNKTGSIEDALAIMRMS